MGLKAYRVHRRLLFVVRGELRQFKLRTVIVWARGINHARDQASRQRHWSEEQIVKRCRASQVTWYEGHQTERRPAGVGLL